MTAGYTLVYKAAVLVTGLGRRSNNVVILNIRGHVLDLVGDAAGALLDLLEGCNEEAVLIGTGVGCKVRDKADVRTFGSLDGAQTAIVAVVYVSDIEGGSFSGKTAGAESRHTALMSKLGQGVCLIHELAQRRGAEELLDSCGHGTDIYKALRGDDVKILQGHALTDDTLHAAETDAELVLQKLTYAADAAVAEVVDIVLGADAVGKAVKVVYRGEHIVDDDVLWDKNIDILGDGGLESLTLVLLEKLLEDDASDLLLDAELHGVKVDIVIKMHHAVGEHANGLAVDIEVHIVYIGSVYKLCLLAGDDLACVGDYLAGALIGNGHCKLKADNAAAKRKLLIELIAADIGNVVAAAVEEQTVKQGLGAFHRRGIAGAQLSVYLDKALVTAGGGVLINGVDDALILTEDLLDALVGDSADNGIGSAGKPGLGLVCIVLAHGLKEPCDGQLAVFIDTDIEHVVCIGLILEPCAVIRDNGRSVEAGHAAVGGLIIVHAGGTDDLRDDDTLSTVDDKGAARSHEREVAHEDLLLLDLLGLKIAQANADLQGCGVCCVSCLALFLVVLGLFVHGIVNEAELELTAVVGDRIGISENFTQAGLQKPLV